MGEGVYVSPCHPHRSSGLSAKQARMAHNTWAVPVCGNHDETLGHLLSKCKAHEHKEYTGRHNSVLYLLTRAVAEKLSSRFQSARRGIRCGVIESGDITMLVDLCIPTDRSGGQTWWSGW